MTNMLTIDVEEWFHILDDPAVPSFEQWTSLESRVERNLDQMLEMLNAHGVQATFFWLGWMAERHPRLVRKCQEEGHEIASHGYEHILPYKVGQKPFREDLERAKKILEDLIGTEVKGFRAPGFGIKDDTAWVFDEIRAVGHTYDSSIFPSSRGHGGMLNSPLGPYVIETEHGPLFEVPMSAIEIFGRRILMFGGGYLRLFPITIIKWGVERLHKANHPLIIYIHPREIDPGHPRLALNPKRSFKSYYNLKSTMPKLEWLCSKYSFCTMNEFVTQSVDERWSD